MARFAALFARAADNAPFDHTAAAWPPQTGQGAPSARIVLVRTVDEHGFAFYTNYHSRKDREIEQNPAAALCSTGPGWTSRCARKGAWNVCRPPSRISTSPRVRAAAKSVPGRRARVSRWRTGPISRRGISTWSGTTKALSCRVRHIGAAIACLPHRIEFWKAGLPVARPGGLYAHPRRMGDRDAVSLGRRVAGAGRKGPWPGRGSWAVAKARTPERTRRSPHACGVSREMATEFLGTFILIVFGVGVVAQVTFSGGNQGLTNQHRVGACGDGGGVHGDRRLGGALESGDHTRCGRAARVSLEQGRTVHGGAVCWRLRGITRRLHHLLRSAEPLRWWCATGLWCLGYAGIWATTPKPFVSAFPGGFIDQVVGTALLTAGIGAITDPRNGRAPAGLVPVLVGLLVVLIGATFGYNTGYAINPARDFGPRLFTALAGWRRRRVHRGWRLVVGADRGALRRRRCWRLCVNLCVGRHFPASADRTESEQ